MLFISHDLFLLINRPPRSNNLRDVIIKFLMILIHHVIVAGEATTLRAQSNFVSICLNVMSRKLPVLSNPLSLFLGEKYWTFPSLAIPLLFERAIA